MPVYASPGQPYRFPQKTTKFLRQRYQGPAVYCWRIERPGLRRVVYIGETDCVVRRLGGVLSPSRIGAETNLRLATLFRALLIPGAEITLELLEFERFVVNGYEVTMAKIRNPYLRKLVEDIAIVTEAEQGSFVLNAGRELVQREKARMAAVVAELPSGEWQKFLKFLKKEFKKAEL